MDELILEITGFAHGGSAIGRDGSGRPVFVPYTLPGERVRAAIRKQKKGYAVGDLLEVLTASGRRVEPRCAHFEVCSGCHFQHMAYDAQLAAKEEVVRDQMARIGGLKDITVRPTIANPSPWAYRSDVSLSPLPGGGLGYWSAREQRIIPIETCHIIHPLLLSLWQDIDMSLAGLRKATLRVGDDESLMVAIEVEGVEPPELQVDFPVSVAIVLPDRTAASLIGDNHLVQSVKEQVFRFAPGCFFQPSPAAAELLVDVVLGYAALSGGQAVLDAYCGVGMLTAFLAAESGEVVGIDSNPDAIADASVNLQERDNVSLYQGRVEDVLPLLAFSADVLVANPPRGLSPAVFDWISANQVERIVTISSDVAAAAHDGRRLTELGYSLAEIQPIDLAPQTFHVETVSLWLPA